MISECVALHSVGVAACVVAALTRYFVESIAPFSMTAFFSFSSYSLSSLSFTCLDNDV